MAKALKPKPTEPHPAANLFPDYSNEDYPELRERYSEKWTAWQRSRIAERDGGQSDE
jgi:hypothetical protein